MKRIVLTCILLSITTVLAVQAEIKITKVYTDNISKSTKVFDLNITIENDGKTINNWALGFYMPQFYRSIKPFNPDLSMSIKNLNDYEENSKIKLVVQKNTLQPKIYSEGYITIVTPESNNFPLKKGSTYTISLNKNNYWTPTNYNSMPQNFFLIPNYQKSIKPSFINIHTDVTNYTVGDYDETKTNKRIEAHLKKVWDQSQDLNANNLVDKYNLVPSPVSILENTSTFLIKNASDLPLINRSKLKLDSTLKIVAEYITKDLNINLNTKDSSKDNFKYGIEIKTADKPEIIKNNPEGYILNIDKNIITIEAINKAGVFYAFQTLRQLWNQNSNLPGLNIIDYPRFEYRGVLFDISRHFFSIEDAKKIIDIAAINKLNTLHVHASDDEGFRLELKDDSLKDLVKIGGASGYAKGSSLPPGMILQSNLDITNYKDFDPNKSIIAEYPSANTLYKGYYTPADIKELIIYANDREITVIPEIDLPGHSRALIFSLPDILIDPADTSIYMSVEGYTDDVIPVYLYNKKNSQQGKRFTDTMNNIIKGVALLFKNQTTIYHIDNEVSVGGDEVSSNCLQNNPNMSQVWKDKDTLDKAVYFFKLLQEGNDELIISGWSGFVLNANNSIFNKDIAVNSQKTGHVWAWKPSKAGIPRTHTLIKNGYPMVLTYADKTYFDLKYTPNIWEPGFQWAGQFLDTSSALDIAAAAKQTYAGLTSEEQERIKGVEGTLWSGNLTTLRHLMYQGVPKITGLAEAAWSPETITVKSKEIDGKTIDAVNWKSLAKRLGDGKTGFLKYLQDTCNIEYRKYPHGIEPLTYPKYQSNK